jgi:FAD:protein FMN transferase
MAAEATWRAMGSDVHVVIVGDAGLLVEARRRIGELERRWSRFLPGSEVSRMNAHAGDPVVVSRDTCLLVERALDGWRLTGGLFDPTVLGDVVRAGYDRSFELLDPDGGPGSSTMRRGAADVTVDPRGLVWLPLGVGFDPGGVGKGLAADLVTEELLAAGAAGALVNVGGDLRVAGESSTGLGWCIDIEGPLDPAPIARVGLHDGGVATSSRARRRWGSDDAPRHHLIDPRTGEPSATDDPAVTVVAAEAWQAEVLAKAAFLAGAHAGLDLVASLGAAALTVRADGSTSTTEAGGVRFDAAA